MDIFAEFATDENLENNGTWFDLKDSRFLIARAGNKAYNKNATKAFQEARNILEKEGDASEAKSEEIMINLLADTILLGWENVVYKKAPLTYSPANARTLLALRDFRTKVTGWSNDVDAFKIKEEIEQGNA